MEPNYWSILLQLRFYVMWTPTLLDPIPWLLDQINQEEEEREGDAGCFHIKKKNHTFMPF